jgi:hypothetical protein
LAGGIGHIRQNRHSVALVSTLLLVCGALVPALGDGPGDWITYKSGSMSFKYPSGWKIEPQLYRTPPEEAAGKPAYPIGLSIFPNGENARGKRSISIGGRQASCDSFLPACKCFTIYVAIYTCADDAETLKTFDFLVESIRYHDPKAAFQIVFPAAQDSLRPNATYTIRWKTRPDLHIRTVNIWVHDTSRPQSATVLSAKDVPNTGSYHWLTPVVDSAGPYIMEVSFVKPMKASPPALASGRIYAGNSNPFYIR